MRKSYSTGLLTLFGLGAYYAWRNRFEIQRFFESKGVNIPLDTSNISNSLRSAASKVVGKVEHASDSMKSSM